MCCEMWACMKSFKVRGVIPMIWASMALPSLTTRLLRVFWMFILKIWMFIMFAMRLLLLLALMESFHGLAVVSPWMIGMLSLKIVLYMITTAERATSLSWSHSWNALESTRLKEAKMWPEHQLHRPQKCRRMVQVIRWIRSSTHRMSQVLFHLSRLHWVMLHLRALPNQSNQVVPWNLH